MATKFSIGGLVRAFRNACYLDDADKRQLRAGLAVIGVGYAALGAVCAIEPAAMQMLVKQFSVTHIPLHAAFTMATGLAGAAGMAAYDRFAGRKIADAEMLAEKPTSQSPSTLKQENRSQP